MPKLGLDSYSYHLHLAEREPREGAFWLLNRVIDLGLDGCQFDPMHLDHWDRELVLDIGAFCRDHGLYLELGSGGFDHDFLAARLELASRAGARVMRTFISGQRGEIPEEQLQEWIGFAKANFRRLASTAERTGVPLALENHEDLTSREIIGILDAADSPWIRACVDTGNALSVGEDPVECVKALAPYAAATHLKDWQVWRENGVLVRMSFPLGRGDARVPEALRILTSARPEMPITIEQPYIDPDPARITLANEDTNIRESIAFVRGEMEERA